VSRGRQSPPHLVQERRALAPNGTGDNANMNSIYLAGKIHSRCWRHDVVEGLEEELHRIRGHWDRRQWPVLPNAVTGGFDCVGPYFSPGDVGHELHGFYYDEAREGNIVVDLCEDALRRADLFFVWIDHELDCHGTLTVIGWAHLLGKPIHVATKAGLEQKITRDMRSATSERTR
jgi:hypothetical protein